MDLLTQIQVTNSGSLSTYYRIEHLYPELWGKDPKLQIVENVVLNIPILHYGIRPGNKILIEFAKISGIFTLLGSSLVGQTEFKIIPVENIESYLQSKNYWHDMSMPI